MQAEDEDQDEGRVERFTGVPGRFEEPAGIIDRPCSALAALGLTAVGQLDGIDWVPADDLVFDCAGKCRSEYIAGIFAASRREHLMATFADSATAAFVFSSGGILALRAAYADSGEFIEPCSDIPDLEFIESFPAKMRDYVQSGECLVFLVRLGREVGCNDVFQPVSQEFGKLRHI